MFTKTFIKARKCVLPDGMISNYAANSHFNDSFFIKFNANTDITPSDFIIKYFVHHDFGSGANILFKIRDFIVKPFNLDGNIHDEPVDCKIIDRNFRSGPFEVAEINDNEILLKAEGRHLLAYFSIFMRKSGESHELYLTTCNYYKIRLGRMYFFIIRPFHAWIVKGMLVKFVKDLHIKHKN